MLLPPMEGLFTEFKGDKSMALETLKGVEKIGGFRVGRNCDINAGTPIVISAPNLIEFQIQDGPIKENGVNGCQVDTLIHAAQIILRGLNDKFPSSYNRGAIQHLGFALKDLEQRTKDREARKVEGTVQYKCPQCERTDQNTWSPYFWDYRMCDCGTSFTWQGMKEKNTDVCDVLKE